MEEEATIPVLTGLKEVVEHPVCALDRDRARHFWLTAKAGEAVDHDRLTPVGGALRALGVRMIPAYSPPARGRSERSFGTGPGRLPQELRLPGIRTVEAANAFLRQSYIAEFTRRFPVQAAPPGSAFVPDRGQDLEHIFSLPCERTVNRDNTLSFQNLTLPIEPVRWRATLAGGAVIARPHLDGTLSLSDGPHCLGRYHERGDPILNLKPAGKAVEKTRGGKVQRPTFLPREQPGPLSIGDGVLTSC